MAKKKIIEHESLNFSIFFFSQLLIESKCEHFLFYGSLLGITRENRAIIGDDDVDFCVNQKDYHVVAAFLKRVGFKIRYNRAPNLTKFFIQAEGKIDSHFIRVDFYFYDAENDDNYLLEYWNFKGDTDNKELVLKIPKPLVFPIKEVNFLSSIICLPQFPEKLCEFLYGDNWRIPIKKDIEYRTIVSNGKPVHIPIKH